MVSVDKAVIARVAKNGITFEVLVDPEKALEFRKGKAYSVENILAVNQVFKDSKKGEKVSNEELKKGFQTTDILKIAETIIKEGDVQLTTEQRRKMVDAKRIEIAGIISRQGVDPKTHAPHPQQRILNAMEQAHVDIDPFRTAKDQVPQVINKLQPIIPIAFERITLAIKIPVENAGKAGYLIREFGEVDKEEWTSTSWIVVLKMPAAMQAALYDKINSLTAGRAEVKIMNREAI